MSFDRVPPGKDLPQDFNVIIEIPAQSDPVKYEADKELGLLVVDRFISTGMRYPANYGFIPQTLSGDGDPVDVLVITPFPLLAGSVVRARPRHAADDGRIGYRREADRRTTRQRLPDDRES